MVSGGTELIRVLGRAPLSILLAVLLTIVAIGFAALWLTVQIYQPHKDYPSPKQLVQIPPGYTVRQISNLLELHGIIRSALIFTWYVRLQDEVFSLKAGEYHFDNPLALADVAAKLHKGEIHHYPVTIPEGFSMNEIIELLHRSGFGSEVLFRELMQNTEMVADLDPVAKNLEGYLFPDTYFFTRNLREEKIVRLMVSNFRRIWTQQRMEQTQELKLTIREVLTLASLIEKETGLDEERAAISAVFHNRLNRGMKLACDPTVIYAVKRIKAYDGVIHQSDLRLDSPYNTYLYSGLPPGPIASPGLGSIDAALYPADVEYLYFVSRNDGRHIFSTNYRTHQSAVRQFQR